MTARAAHLQLCSASGVAGRSLILGDDRSVTCVYGCNDHQVTSSETNRSDVQWDSSGRRIIVQKPQC